MDSGPNGIATIFGEAIEISSPAERESFLERTCGRDTDLRRRVEQLLDDYARAGDFLEQPATDAMRVMPQITEGPGTQIGPYKLLEQIGEGGMGTVFMAEQQKPVRRMVALKIVKPGMDTKQVIAHFEAERQALALMNHPNIARVLDVGTTGPEVRSQTSEVSKDSEVATLSSDLCSLPSSSGRPYFVMELVRGIPITDYCDQARLPVAARLELFVQVCRAVQHAHTNGIIHRDLKPSNVLVTLHDSVPVPKIIDFGIAKATHGRLTDRTLFTQFAQMLGTPLYMSPEQAEMSGLGVDTRSDIYSLGVLLYELLTGTTPFDKETLSKVGYDEMRRIIREDEPASVSARIGTLSGDQQTTISARRGVDMRTLVRQTRGELDWIVMKALEKDRTRRYESASAFAADVERYLHDEPVEACPPSAVYRLRKLTRRHRVALATGAVVLSALLAGTGVSVWQAIDATNARELADERLASETQAHQETEKQQQQADEQRRLAEANLEKALEAVDQMLIRVADEKLARIPGLGPVRNQLLDDALQFYKQFLEQRGDDPALRFTAAQTWQRVGSIRDRLGDHAKALPAYGEAVRISDDLLREHPEDVNCLELLARCCVAISAEYWAGAADIHQSEDAFNRGLAAYRHLQRLFPNQPERSLAVSQLQVSRSALYMRLGRESEAFDLCRDAIQSLQDYIADHPHDLRVHLSLMSGLRNFARSIAKRDFDEADRLLAQAEQLGAALLNSDVPQDAIEGRDDAEAERTLAFVLIERSQIREGRGRAAEQEAFLRRAIARLDSHFSAHPDLPTPPIWSRSNFQLGKILSETGRKDEAIEFMRRAVQAERNYDAEHPHESRSRQESIYFMMNLAILIAERDFDEADRLLADAEALGESLVRDDNRPKNNVVDDPPELVLAQVLHKRALIRTGTGRFAEQEAFLRRAIALVDGQLAVLPESPRFRHVYWYINAFLGNILSADGQTDEAESVWRRTCQVLLKNYTPDRLVMDNLAQTLQRLASLLAARNRGDDEEFAAMRRQFVAIFEKELRESEVSETPSEFADRLVRAGRIYGILNETARAESAHQRVMAIGPDALSEGSANLIATVLFNAANYREALPYLDQALKLTSNQHADIRKRRARAYFEVGRFRDALADLKVAVELNAADASNLTGIPPSAVAACPDEDFRVGLLALADETVRKNSGNSAALIVRRGLLAELGQWERARDDFEKVLPTAENAHYVRYQHALVCLAMHDEAAYRADCAEMLRQSHDSRNADELHFAAWICALAPNAVADMSVAIELARRAVEISKASRPTLQSLGATLFRAGQFEDALEALERCEASAASANISPAYAWYFRALTCFKLGKASEAREWYEKSVAQTTRTAADGSPEDRGAVPWNRRLTLELLRSEAAALLGKPLPAPTNLSAPAAP